MKTLKLFKPSVALYKETHLDKPNQYFLHTITFCDNSNYIMDGFRIEEKSDEKVLKVELLARQQLKKTSINTLMPIVHTLTLGAIAFEEKGSVEVSFLTMNEDGVAYAARSIPPTTVVGVPQAIEIGKPIPEDDSIEGLWNETFSSSTKEEQ